MGWLGQWLGFGFGAAAGKALFSPPREDGRRDDEPIRPKTEAEIQADEKRFDEDEKRIEAAAQAERQRK